MNVAKSLRAPFFYWTPPVNFIIDFITINNVFEQLFYRTPPVNFIIDFITINNVQFLSDGTSFSIRLQRMPLLLGRCCFISCFDVIEYCYKFKINHGSSYKIDLQCAAQIDMVLSVNSTECFHFYRLFKLLTGSTTGFIKGEVMVWEKSRWAGKE